MIAILKHELRTYFHSLTAYVFGAFLLMFIGIGAMLYNLQAAVSNFEFVLSFGCLIFVGRRSPHASSAATTAMCGYTRSCVTVLRFGSAPMSAANSLTATSTTA